MEEKTNASVRAHLWISGRVQGVGFRNFTQQSAAFMGLTGWVRNVGYRQVEIVVEGEREAVEKFIQVVKVGPRAAHVDEAHVEWETVTGEYLQFGIRF